MKTLPLLRVLVLVLVLAGLAGCATHQKIDWSARVGSYTFDQAVLDFGPPAKQAKLTDGSLVAEWQTQRGYAQTYFPPYPGYRYHYYGYYSAPITTYSPDTFLRLTFGPDGVLKAWQKVVL